MAITQKPINGSITHTHTHMYNTCMALILFGLLSVLKQNKILNGIRDQIERENESKVGRYACYFTLPKMLMNNAWIEVM